MLIYIYTLISILCFSAFNATVKVLPAKIHIVYVLPFVILGGSLVALLSLLLPKVVSYENIVLTKSGMFYAAIMGAIWVIGQLSFLHLFAKSPSLSMITPIMVGGVALGGTLSGFFIFKEPITMMKVLGMVGILIGIFFVSRG